MPEAPSRRAAEQLVRGENAIDRIGDWRPRWLLTPHEHGQIQFLRSRQKIRVAIPGNGWGKTTTMAMAFDMAIQKEDPYNPDLIPKHPLTCVWVTPKFQQFEIIKRQLEEEIWTRPWEWNQTRHFYRWPNGGQLHVVSSDSDWQHIQGIPVDLVGFDEHPERKLWNEFMFRRRGKRKTRYMVAATMTLGLTWFVREVVQQWESFHKAQGLTAANARQLQAHPDIWVWDHGGIRDNPAMSEEDVRHYESIGHASDKELRVRLEGGYADFSGDQVFDPDALDLQLPNVSPGDSGSLHLIDSSEVHLVLPDGSDASRVFKQRMGGRTKTHYINFLKDGQVEGGRVTIWEPPDIASTYVMGADFAAGLIGRDYDCAIVLKKNADGMLTQVAEARGWWGDMTFAEIMYMLGIWYFNAFICGERQFGLPTLRRLYDERHYAWIYRGRLESTRSRRVSDLLGHHRSPGDTIIPNLRAALCRQHITLRSADLMQELRQYQYRPRHGGIDPEEATSDKLITTAPTGMNDDMVLALAYAWHAAREVGRFALAEPEYAPGTFGELFQNSRVLKGLPPRRPGWHS